MTAYHNALMGTTLIGTGLPEPVPGYAAPVELTMAGKVGKARRTITRPTEFPVDPKRLENCTILTPEEHEEIDLDAYLEAPDVPAYETVRLALLATDEPPALPQFLEMIDALDMGGSVDLAFWLTIHRKRDRSRDGY